MELRKLLGVPHRRYNPLTREWILISPHRTQRPWQGQLETTPSPSSSAYDPNCYLCPGNERAGGSRNPPYSTTLVFDNDFAALRLDVEYGTVNENNQGILVAAGESGTCRVICFSPRHDLTLSSMTVDGICKVVEVWIDQFRELGDHSSINYVQIFENRGEMMGCSNPHPHGQIWASESVPNEPRKEQDSLADYRRRSGRCLICDYIRVEAASEERIVCQNEHFVVVVPFWASWPFEVLVLCKKHRRDICDLDDGESFALADILKRVTTRYDNLFQVPFPYSMGFHQRPTDGDEHLEWHFHGHFFPPLLRSASVRKFMVGYELLASPQRDITPETAAERLRNCSEHCSS